MSIEPLEPKGNAIITTEEWRVGIYQRDREIAYLRAKLKEVEDRAFAILRIIRSPRKGDPK